MNARTLTGEIAEVAVPVADPRLRSRLILIVGVVLAFAWTAAIIFSLLSNHREAASATLELARQEARASLAKDMLYRHWVSSHGGVYVPVTPTTPPNPLLTNLVERDVTTSSGQKLTLVNAAYMNRQVRELGKEISIPTSHLTSLKPVLRENAADPWETNALKSIERGRREFSSLEDETNGAHLRFMQALVIEKSCLTCHVTEGYKEGERHGGLSIRVDMSPYLASKRSHLRHELLMHSLLWVFGMCGLVSGTAVVRRRVRDRDTAIYQLQAAKLQLADFYDHAPDIFVQLDYATGRILNCNHTLTAYTGRSAEALIGQPLADLCQGASGELLAAALKQLPETGAIHGLELQLPDRQGTRLDFELNATAIRDQNGTLTGCRLVLRDITTAKQLELALRQSETRYRIVSENTTDWVFWLSPEGRFLYCSPSAEPLTGHPPGAFLRDAGLLERLIHPDDLPGWRHHRCEAARQNQPAPVDYRITGADGTLRWIHHACQPVVDERGRFLGTRSSNTDVTAQRAAAAALERHRELLKVVSAAAGRFLRAPVWRTVVDEVLAQLGRATGVSRVVVFDRQPGGDDEIFISQVHEWAGTGMELRTGDPSLNRIPMRAGGFGRWAEALGQGRSVRGHVRDFPASEARVLAKHHILSIVVVPIMVAGDWWGFLAFDECTDERNWRPEEVEALETAANLLGEIIERERAAVALRESEDRFRSLYENSTVGIYRTTPAGHILLANPALVRLLGYGSFAELAARNLEQSGFEPGYARRQFIETIERDGEIRGLESVWQRRDGTAIFVRENARAVRDATGRTLYYDGMVEDVTERKQAEDRSRKLSFAVEQSPVLIAITDPAGLIEYVNPKFTAVTGYALTEVSGRNPRLLKSGHTTPEEYRRLWETIKSGREWRGEFQNRKKNGELYWELASISPLVNEAGQITHFLAVKEDITERKKLEAQFRQAQKMEAVGQLAGGVAHDFNNIISSILMHLGLLRNTPDLDPFLAESLNELEAESKRAAALTRQLLLFGRRSVMQIQALNLNEVVENLLKMLRRLIGEQVVLEWQPQPQLPGVSGDAGMLEQVVMNLVVNARDAMPQGGRILLSTAVVDWSREEVRANVDARPGRFVRLRVTDSGTGIQEQVLRRIFEPFFTTKEVGKGTGLGLATVYSIAQQHRGWVEAESQVGTGSVFSFYLPALSEIVAPAATESAARPITGGSATILLVEDELNVRKSVASFLRFCGYRIIEATNGPEALALWAKFATEIELLFTDMIMPGGMNGLELAESLLGHKPGLRVIIHSGYSADLVRTERLEQLGITYLAKPSTPAALADAVGRCLARRRHPGTPG